jgi:pyrroloquinoline quinone (PQQ) biosynthesis protein C
VSETPPDFDARTELKKLVEHLSEHEALDNAFYRAWMSRPFGVDAIAVFVRNYGAFVRAFPNVMAELIRITDDLDAKTEHTKTLYSEMGYGNPKKLHSVLFDTFFDSLAEKLGHPGKLARARLERDLVLLPTSRRFIDGEFELYGHKDVRVAVGAQLAQEWQAYGMLRQLYEGARNYAKLWSVPDEFHEACEYYYVHIGAAEKEHKDESLAAALRYAHSPAHLAKVREGFDTHLQLYVDFWNGIHGEMMKVES